MIIKLMSVAVMHMKQLPTSDFFKLKAKFIIFSFLILISLLKNKAGIHVIIMLHACMSVFTTTKNYN